MTCGGCGSPRPAGKEQKKSYRAQTRILISSSPGMYYNNLCLVTFVGWGGDRRWGRGYDVRWVWFTTPCWERTKEILQSTETNSAFVITRCVLQQFVPCHLCGVGGAAGGGRGSRWGRGGDMTCGGCGSPRPAGKEQKKSYRVRNEF